MNPQVFANIANKIKQEDPQEEVSQPQLIDGVQEIYRQREIYSQPETLDKRSRVRSTKRQFYRPWSKLTKDTKIQLLINYIHHICRTYQLTEQQINHLSYLLISAINHQMLLSDEEVEYDRYKSQIIAINKLYYCPHQNEFQLLSEVDADKCRQSWHHLTKIDRRIPLQLRLNNNKQNA